MKKFCINGFDAARAELMRRGLLRATALLGGLCAGHLAHAQTPIYTQVSTGDSHACAVTTSGRIHCWGENSFGKLGNGSRSSSSVPTPVRGIGAATRVSAGRFHSCMVAPDGSATCWGYGGYGALGHGDYNDSNIPTAVVSSGQFLDIHAGAQHTCSRHVGGYVGCWGRNDWGQLGVGNFNSTNAIVSVPTLSGVEQVAVGAYHTCALKAGEVWCWGANDRGQLGIGSTIDRFAGPSSKVTGISDAVAIAAGAAHTCALRAPGNVLDLSSVVCWGDNTAGQLGTGSNGSFSNTPVTVANLGSTGNTPDVVAAGAQHTCARLLDATVQCWGLASYGAVGDGSDGSVAYRLSPTTVAGLRPAASGLNATTTSLAAGNNTTCTIMTDGGIRCWGYNEFGQGGHGHGGTYQTTPQYVAAPGCALDVDGDGVALMATDAVLLTRALRGASGAAVTTAAAGPGTRTTWGTMAGHLTDRCGVTGLVP